MNNSLENTKFIQLFLLLDEKEKEQFNDWISFIGGAKKGGRMISAYKEILKLDAEGLAITQMGILRLFVDIKEGEIDAKADKLLRNLFHKLYNNLRDFLAWKKLNENKQLKERLVQDELLERKAYKLTYSENLKSIKTLSRTKTKNVSYFSNAALVNEISYYLSIILRNRHTSDNLESLIRSICSRFLSHVLMYYCAAKNRELILGVNYDLPFKQFVMDYLSVAQDAKQPFISVYYNIYRMLDEQGGENYYYKAKEALLLNEESFGTTDKRHIINFLVNFCNMQIKDGRDQFISEKFTLFNFGLKNKIWFENIYFSENVFIQIVKNSILLDELTHCKMVVEDYGHYLSPKVKNDISNYALALLKFAEKDFKSAEIYKNRIITTKDFSYYLDYNILTIKILFENFEKSMISFEKCPINSTLEAMRQYLSFRRNKKMGKQNQMAYSNFVKSFSKIWRRVGKIVYKEKKSKEDILQLKETIKRSSPIVEKKWLIEKIDNFF